MSETAILEAKQEELPKSAGSTQPFRWILPFSVIGLTLGAYVGTVRFRFVFDDHGQIIGNSYVQFWRHVPKYFISQVWANIFPRQAGNYYRPLFLLWLRINDALFGFNPHGWHAAALLLHVISTILVYFLFRKLIARPEVAAFGALVFGLHPIHAEVVAWISGATESLLAVFFLAAFLAYLKSREGNAAIWMTLSCVLFALAVFSKEAGIVLPALVFCHAWIYGSSSTGGRRGFGPGLTRGVRAALPYAPLGVFYLIVRHSVLHGFGHASIHLGWRTDLFTMPSMMAFYLKKWFLPIRLTEFYDLPYLSGWNFWHFFLPALCIVGVGVALWFERRQLGEKEVAFASLWMLIPMLPVLYASVFPPHDIVHDRYFYLPSVGASLVVALAVQRLTIRGAALTSAEPAPAFLLAFLAFGATLAVLASHEASFWRDDITMFSRAHTLAPLNPVARNDYGVELASLGYDDAARAVFHEAIQADSKDWAAYFNLGRIAYEEGNYADAEYWLRQANIMNHNAPDVYVDLGLTDLRTNRLGEALGNMRTAVELRPNDPNYLFAYGVVLAQSGDCTSAEAQLRAALEIRPNEGMTQLVLHECEMADSHK